MPKRTILLITEISLFGQLVTVLLNLNVPMASASQSRGNVTWKTIAETIATSTISTAAAQDVVHIAESASVTVISRDHRASPTSSVAME